MDAVAVLARIARMQGAFQVIGTLMLTAYLFPKQAVVIDQEEFDFIVVGAGSAGAVVAARLAQCHFKVLLVEAGGDPPQESLTPGLLQYIPHTQYDWNYTTEKTSYSFQCHRSKTANLTSGRVLGGGSSINYLLYARGCPGDFTPWAIAAEDATWDWPGVLPYFMKSEKLQDQDVINSPEGIYHGTEGFLGVKLQRSALVDKYLKGFGELGHKIILDINANQHTGYNQPMHTIRDGIRQSTANTILAAQKRNKFLHVMKNTFVDKIIFDKDNNAVGIKVTTKDNKQMALKAKKEVIISAGVYSTPRLLMLSGIGPANHLQAFKIPVISDLPVGENLQDHPAVLISTTLEKSTEQSQVRDPRLFPFDTFTGYVALNKSNVCPDYQTINYIIPHDSPGILGLSGFSFGLEFDISQNLFTAGHNRRTLLTGLVLLHPKSRGRVKLRSTNPTDPPLIYGGYISDDQDLETIVDGLMDFVKVYKTPFFRSFNAHMVDLKLVGCSKLEYWSREWWRCYARCMMISTYHPIGTCAMGSVVDSHLRVFGVNRLRVVDASVMPELVSTSTNPAVIMTAEKAVDFIKEDHSCNADSYSSIFPSLFVPQ